ncbi:MAG: DNA repair protein RecN [Bacteroidia bacterium]|nr:DNA repair protein RecN [Bacteroidia bacterium]NNL33690.1 DNA repair protein RecN [Flavobacteriaceae bacterium]
MITSLSIKNYALIEDLHVNFNDGLTIITGETGAGKSILIEGLSLILGKRADIMSVKNTSKKCIIEGTFKISSYNLEAFFTEEDIDYDPETIIRREILPSGKSRAFINDSPVNLSTLTTLGEQLIDVHSQHQNLALTDDNYQFQVIDALANNDQKLNKYSSTLASYKTLRDDLDRLNALKADAIKEQDYNAFLYNELVEADLSPGELEHLEQEQKSLSNYETIRDTMNEAVGILNDDHIGGVQSITLLSQKFKKLSDLNDMYLPMYERVQSVLIELKDINSDVEHLQEKMESDPLRLDVINDKLSAIHNLMLKHTAKSVDELIRIRDKMATQLDVYENVDDEILRKQAILKAKKEELDALALRIHEDRENAIPNLIDALQHILGDLGMENARFELMVSLGEEYYEHGKDVLTFLFSANKGSEPKPLKYAISGGEISRIMLAIKAVLTNYMQLPTIIFDEIDTGVSGEISNKMAAIMKEMSKHMQVFAITHLPQIAGKGNSHLKVFKEDKNNMTITQIKELSREERVVEIAQMLSGNEMTNSAIAHAKELLN